MSKSESSVSVQAILLEMFFVQYDTDNNIN